MKCFLLLTILLASCSHSLEVNTQGDLETSPSSIAIDIIPEDKSLTNDLFIKQLHKDLKEELVLSKKAFKLDQANPDYRATVLYKSFQSTVYTPAQQMTLSLPDIKQTSGTISNGMGKSLNYNETTYGTKDTTINTPARETNYQCYSANILIRNEKTTKKEVEKIITLSSCNNEVDFYQNSKLFAYCIVNFFEFKGRQECSYGYPPYENYDERSVSK